jgi:hypothetical protein
MKQKHKQVKKYLIGFRYIKMKKLILNLINGFLMPSRTVQNVKVKKRNNIHQLKKYEKDN